MADNILLDTEEYILVRGNNRIKRMRSILASKRSNTTGSLSQSITIKEVKGKAGIYGAVFGFDGYARFVDEGVRGVGGASDITGKAMPNRNTTSQFRYGTKKPPIDEIEGWVRNKLRSGGNDLWTALNVRESIYRRGTKPTNFLQDTILDKEELKKFSKEIGKRAKTDILNVLIKQ